MLPAKVVEKKIHFMFDTGALNRRYFCGVSCGDSKAVVYFGVPDRVRESEHTRILERFARV
jgi:hypothetical protein